MSKTKRFLSIMLVVLMLSAIPFGIVSAADEDISALPIAKFDVYGTTLDRGFLAAKISNGVFLSWRFFPDEATGVQTTSGTGVIGPNGGLVGANFAIFKNGVKLADVADSTDYLDASGTVTDKYTVVTVVGGEYVSRTEELTPAAQTSDGNYLKIPVTAPPRATGKNTGSYYMDEMSAADVDGDGQLEFVLKWETGAPDVISGGYQAPVIYDCYKMDGTRLWRIDMGINVRAGQHYLQPMLYDFDGDGKAEFMIQTAPGTKDGTGAYITMPETVHTRWDGTKNWSHTDDYRTTDGDMAAATRQNGATFQWMVQFFKNWQNHPEVKEARYGANNELLYDSKAAGGFGWWKYPPQVMLGLYQTGYVGINGAATANGSQGVYARNTNVSGWTQAQWDILNAMPKDPEAFKSHVITDDEALALAYLWYVSTAGGSRHNTSGHIYDGPEFFTVFNGATGAEMDTIPYAVPRGIVNPDGSYTPDIGIMWNDMATNNDEPYNRVYRYLGAVAYLDGNGKNASCIQVRGYYSRTTVTRYDWDGVNLTSEVFVDSGFEVCPNPFVNNDTNIGAPVTGRSNTHGGPGRFELCFNPAAPLVEKPEMIATVELANKYGSITCQGYHSPSVMDVNGDGKDEFIIGQACFDGDGNVLWVGYEQRYGTGANLTNKTGAIEKLGHGDSLHVGFFEPSQSSPMLLGCLEGGWWDSVLRYADTGAIIRTDSPGSATAWGSQRDNGRAMVGKFTTEPGWQYYTRGTNASPIETMNGLRQYTGAVSQYGGSVGTDSSIFWGPDLYTQATSRNISAKHSSAGGGGALTTSGTRVSGGSKNQPAYVADVLGDYREELILSTTDNNEIRIYFNTEESNHKLATLQADRRYRCEIERQKTTYNQPSYPGFYYGADMNLGVYFESIQPYTVPVVTPKITEIDIGAAANIVATLSAYVNVDVTGENLEGVELTAYLLVGNDRLYGTPVVNGRARIFIPAAPEAGAYKIVVLGEDIGEQCDITVLPYNLNIWTATAFGDQSGKLAIKFNANIASKTNFVDSVKVGSEVYSASVVGDDTLSVNAGYDDIAAGTIIVISGVKFPILFPTYSFTFTIAK